MNYTINRENKQLENEEKYIKIPNTLERFVNTYTEIKNNKYLIYGYVKLSEDDLTCNCCHNKMHININREETLKHVSIGLMYSNIIIDMKQLVCSNCGFTKMQSIPFKDENHFITIEAKENIKKMLNRGNITLKNIASLSGVNRNVVKDIDKERLYKLYTKNGEGKELIQPSRLARFLCIDEFKLHNGYQYATHIINQETGEVLWIECGKKKQVVYNFMEFVGPEFMENVEAVACDMNSDFEEAFVEKYPHIKIVYDYFHIEKNFNEKVIAKIRIDEQERLKNSGDKEAAERLKRTRFLLCSSEKTLKEKDRQALEGKVISSSSELFNLTEIKRKGDYYKRYEKLVNENELFLVIELIKELLNEAYSTNSKVEMENSLYDIMALCEGNGNEHLLWFKNLIYNHLEGIVTHADIKISTGKIEGVNNKIKTLRRQAYGYPDDEYFFLKIIDITRSQP
jgi:transposase